MKITDALVAEHTIYLNVFAQIERALPGVSTLPEVRTMAGIVEGLLRDHAARECQLAYLALDHVLAEKGHLERMYQDHHEIDGRLEQVHTAKTCAEARRLLQAAISFSREHFQIEERLVFPLIEQVLQPETLAGLGRSWLERNPEPVAAR